jgi:hypothetical protein
MKLRLFGQTTNSDAGRSRQAFGAADQHRIPALCQSLNRRISDLRRQYSLDVAYFSVGRFAPYI